jgi:hypothetical protein
MVGADGFVVAEVDGGGTGERLGESWRLFDGLELSSEDAVGFAWSDGPADSAAETPPGRLTAGP